MPIILTERKLMPIRMQLNGIPALICTAERVIAAAKELQASIGALNDQELSVDIEMEAAQGETNGTQMN